MQQNYTTVRVLIIDDDVCHQKAISSGLTEYDIEPVITNQASKALEEIEAGEFALILVSLAALEIDACEMVEAMRSQLKCNVPIVAISSQPIEDIKGKCFGVGMNAVISKPIDRVELAAMMTHFLPKIVKSSPAES